MNRYDSANSVKDKTDESGNGNRLLRGHLLPAHRFLMFFLLMVLYVSTGCSVQADKRADGGVDSVDEKMKVVTTIFPQYDFVRQIAGDKVELQMLLKPGEESHSYEPTPQDIIAIQNCDLFIYVGGENDVWVEDILSSLDKADMRTLRLIDCVNAVEEEHVEGMKEERSVHEEGDYDEHVWTSPLNAVKIVDNIDELLCQIDSKNETKYRQRTKSYIEELETLDNEFREVVSVSSRKSILFGDRFPFRYFADAYGLKYFAAFPGCASDTEPSAATMAFLINQVKDKKIPVVLKMELSNENIANAIAEATGTDVNVFYSCHNITAAQFNAGETYLSMMEKNVGTLKEALGDGTD